MESCIYQGWVRHRRYLPRANHFQYRLFMMYLDLEELPRLFKRRLLWSHKRFNMAYFRRSDYIGPTDQSLDLSVRDLVEKRTGVRPVGPIRLLTNMRYWGYGFNPVSFYYCFDLAGTKVETVIAEITNTPWGEKHCYVLPAHSALGIQTKDRFYFPKAFHVSPFLPMEQEYGWRFTPPTDRLAVHMDNWEKGTCHFDATLVLKRCPINAHTLARVLWTYPIMTMRIMGTIYWQAFRLWFKKIPFYTHPKHNISVVENHHE